MRFILVFILFFFSCSTKKEHKNKYNFDYLITENYKTNLIQVFDDNITTYLHFLELEKIKKPKVFYNKRKLQYETERNFLLINNIYTDLEIVVGKHSSIVKNLRKVDKITPQIKKKGELN